jgi:DNA-binding MarR family transcriptional regulator
MSVVDALPPTEAPPPRLGAVLDFLRLIWHVDHALQRRSKRMEADLGVTGPQRLVIRIVGRFPGIAAGHLARMLHVHPSTLTGVIKRLERQRLLRKRVDPRDGRRVLLSLTEEGRSLDTAAAETVEAAVAHVLARVSPQKIAAAREVLVEMATSLEGPERGQPNDAEENEQ